MSIVDRILRIGEGRTLKKLDAIADQVESLAGEFSEFPTTSRSWEGLPSTAATSPR